MRVSLSWSGCPLPLERVAGIEPASSAWKAEVLPLNYTRLTNFPALSQDPAPLSVAPCGRAIQWWRGKDLNLRRLSRQIYSLIPLTTREPLLQHAKHDLRRQAKLSTNGRNYFLQQPLTVLSFRCLSAAPNHPALLVLVPHYGAATRSRTLDLLITSELLYQLSYGGRNGSRIL